MTPFGAKRAASFFGREKEIGELATLVRWQHFLIVIGASGSGKSSLVFAGVVPRLETAGQWLIRDMRPEGDPMATLAAKLGVPTGGVVDWAAAAEALLDREKRERLLLVIDQLEEVFSLADKTAQVAFLRAIRSLKKSPRCVALMTMRADFFEDLLKSELAPIDQNEQMSLSALRGSSLRDAIVKPAERQGVYLEPGLIDRLLTDAADEPGVLPMLQETMVLLWEKMGRRLLTERAYRSLDPNAPGIAVALSLRGQAALAELTESQRVVAKRILLRLINFGEGRADTRRRQLIGDLHSAGEDAAEFTATLDQLARNRILTLDAGRQDGIRVDLAHECLILGWPTLRHWVESRRDAEMKRRRLLEKAKEWVRLKEMGGLLDEVEIEEAELWIRGSDGAELGVDPVLKNFVEASRKQIHWQVISRRIVRAGYATLAFAIAIILWIWVPQQMADEARDQMRQSSDPKGKRAAVREASRAVRLHNMQHTREVLQETVQAMEPHGRFPDAFEVTGVAFNEDGTRLAGSAASGEVIVVPVADSSASQTLHTTAPVDLLAVAFRPKKPELAAATADGRVVVWNLDSESLREQGGHTQPVTCVAYSRAGDLLATGSQDSTILIRDAETLQNPRKLIANGRINRLAFSPDGKYLAAATAEYTAAPPEQPNVPPEFAAKLWEVSSGKLVRDFRRHKREVTDIAFSPNGGRLVTSSADGRLRIWDVRDTHAVEPSKELSHPHDESFGGDEGLWMAHNAFSAVTYDADGDLASTMNLQNFAEVWDIAAGQPKDRLLGHQGGIISLAYNSAGGKHKLATAGVDHKIRLYYLEIPDLIAKAKLILQVNQAGPLPRGR